ncbi:MAG: HD domain-containing protein [Gammaproteobacteria bacterium]|nr:HD domain-containing protein [Gammaproteobacteria bacterium]
MGLALPSVAQFLLELDKLKLVERRTYVFGGERRENVAEHSWHVAMAAWALSSYLGRDVSVGKLVQLALVHDLGELDAGDTFLYATDRNDASESERKCVSRLAREYDSLMPNLEALWTEQERGESEEARLLKVADRLLPFLHNIASEGKTWREHNIAKSQVLRAHAFIASEAPELFQWMEAQLDHAVESGWLGDS